MASPHFNVNIFLPGVIGSVRIGQLGKEWPRIASKWMELDLIGDEAGELQKSVEAVMGLIGLQYR